MKGWRLLVGGAVLFAFTGCTARLVDFTIISTKNVKVPQTGRGARVMGKDCSFFGVPNIKEALDKAIEGAGPDYDALVDGVLYQSVFFVKCFKVEGTPINSKIASIAPGTQLAWHSTRAPQTTAQ